MDRAGSGLRRLTILLVILNLAVLLAGWAGSKWRGRGAPLETFNADKIQLLEDVLPEDARPVGGTLASAGGGADCPAWPGLDADGVAQVQAHLRKAGIADADYDLLVGMRMGWWVYIPPLESAAALRVVMEDARAKGVKDMAPVRGGALPNALGLGTFETLESARQHAQAMLKKGLRDVRFGPRPGAGPVWLVVVRESAELRRALTTAWPAGLAPSACKPE